MRQRADGFHDIETVIVPVRGLFDTLSVSRHPASGAPHPAYPLLEVAGAGVDCPPEDNICMRALRLMQREFGENGGDGQGCELNIGRRIDGTAIRLHKNIPAGAGLGGGSSDAAFTMRALNEEFALGLSDECLERLSAELGSDVPFFIRNTPQLCTGRGEIMAPAEVDLAGKWLAILKPPVSVPTAEAYAGITPREEAMNVRNPRECRDCLVRQEIGMSLPEILKRPVDEWRELLVNDFEESVFKRHPEIRAIKQALYNAGAVYASMSGSGSAVFGIFDRQPELAASRDIFIHIEYAVTSP